MINNLSAFCISVEFSEEKKHEMNTNDSIWKK